MNEWIIIIIFLIYATFATSECNANTATDKLNSCCAALMCQLFAYYLQLDGIMFFQLYMKSIFHYFLCTQSASSESNSDKNDLNNVFILLFFFTNLALPSSFATMVILSDSPPPTNPHSYLPPI